MYPEPTSVFPEPSPMFPEPTPVIPEPTTPLFLLCLFPLCAGNLFSIKFNAIKLQCCNIHMRSYFPTNQHKMRKVDKFNSLAGESAILQAHQEFYLICFA